jgi:tyrosine-protein kinase
MTTEIDAELTLRAYMVILYRQRWWITGAVALGLTVGLSLPFVQAKQYSAQAQVLIRASEAQSGLGAVQQPLTPTDVQTQLQLVASAPVRAAVRRELGSEPDVSASQVAQTNVIAITATGPKPASAARVANAYARAYVAYQQNIAISNLSAAEDRLRAQISGIAHNFQHLRAKDNSVQGSALLNQEAVLKEQLAQLQVSGVVSTNTVELVTPATAPTSPSSPGLIQDGGLGLAAGLLLGLAVALFRNNLNDVLSSKEAVEKLGGVPVLATVPLVASWKKRNQATVMLDSWPTSPAAEAYRSLRTSLQFIRHERPLRTLLVTSPGTAEGKTFTVANLGTAFAQAGERVVVVSCDLRRPQVSQALGLSEEPGLTSIVLGQQTLSQAIQPVPGRPGMHVLGTGPLPPNPAELLSTTAVHEVLADLREQFDLVLIDSPPILPVTDAAVLSSLTDATLLVVAADQTRQGQLRSAAEKFSQLSVPVIGTVINKMTKSAGASYGYGYGYGHEYHAAPIGGLDAAAHTNGHDAGRTSADAR